MSAYRITKIIRNEDGINPVLLNFQNGTPQENIEKNLTCGLFEDDKSNQKVAVALGESLYTGDVKKNKYYNNFIAIKNNKNKEVYLIEVNSALLASISLDRTRDLDFGDSPKVTKYELNKQFGSKRTQRKSEQYEKIRMNAENVAHVLEKTAAEVEINEADLVQPDVVDDGGCKPPINRNASVVEDVYDINLIAPMDVLSSLSDDIAAVLDSDETIIKNNLCPFVCGAVLKMKEGKANQKKLQILIYIDCLIKMLCSNAKNITSKKFNPCPNFPKIGSYILDNFTLLTNNHRCRPSSMRDKTICYILVLSVLTSNNELDLEILRQDTKCGVKKLAEMGRNLGFTLSKQNILQLKLPLPPPILPTFRGKRGRK